MSSYVPPTAEVTRRVSYDVGGATAASAPVAPLSMTSTSASPTSPRGASGERFKHYDEHVVTLEELERRFDSNRLSGLLAHVVSRSQNENPRLNLLPTDVDVGHGNIHELVAVLRDGSWIHTRAENLLVGDIISLKEGQCVPADVRLIECEGMWVDQSALLGKRGPEPRVATTTSVFDAAEATVHYLESPNMAFYGTVVARGQGKAIVVRTGDETVLGSISAKLLQSKRSMAKHADVPLSDSMKQLEVFCKGDRLPSAVNRVSALVVEHNEIVKRSIISSTFGVSPPVIIELEDMLLANETSTEELEHEIAVQMINCSPFNSDARFFMKALAACRHRVENTANGGSSTTNSSASTARVPSLPQSSPIAPPLVLDPLRDQNAVLRFSTHFGLGSPKNSMNKKARFSTLLHGQISGCEVYVHFDQEQGAHVVVLQGPSREVLSRCGKVRRDETISPLETSDLQQLQAMVVDLEARGQTVVSFAELYLDPSIYPVGVKFDIENFNFPTSSMCYLGSLGLVEKIQPEVVLMSSFARSADVSLMITTCDREYGAVEPIPSSPDESESEEEALAREANRVRPICAVPLRIREAASGEIVDVEAVIFRSDVLSISNTLAQWKQLLLEYPVVIFDGCNSSHIDLLVETLQELGECVGLVASGSSNAVAIANADIGFAIPSQDFIDLGEEAADVVLASVTCPRSDAIRLIELAKKLPRLNSPKNRDRTNSVKARSVMTSLFREVLSVGRALGLSESELTACFENASSETSTADPAPVEVTTPQQRPAVNPLMPPLSPSKFPASAFRSSSLLSTNAKVGVAALSAGVAGVGPSASTALSRGERRSMALRIETGEDHGPPTARSSRRPSTGAKKVHDSHPVDLNHPGGPNTIIAPLQDGLSRPSSSDSAYLPSRPSSSASNASIPSEAIYNTQFTTAGRKFLSKVKKNRAMQVDRRTKGFQRGLDGGTMILDPITKKHFRVMIVDPDLQHREELADALELHFEIFVAATNDRAFALLAMFKVDFVLLRLALGNDHSLTTSTGLEFLREIKKRYSHVPVALLLRSAKQQEKLLAQALSLGGCGYFEDDVEVDTLIDRLRKLLHSLVLASVELVKCRGKALGSREDDDEHVMRAEAAQALIQRGTAAVASRRAGSSKPPTLEYDKEKMLLELSLNQRKQCLERRKQLTETLATSHSVLGIGIGEERAVGSDGGILAPPMSTLRSASLMHCESSKSLATLVPSSPSLVALRANSIMKKIPPLPSAKEISKRIYTKPHEIQVKIHHHLYESYHMAKHDAVPHDPLLRPCVAVDPETISRSATNLLVGKAYKLYLEKRYEEAHQQCDRAIRVQDNNVVKLAYLLRGVLYDLSGNHARAEQEFLTTLKIDPSMHQAHFNLCVCRLKRGRDQQALQDVTTALHLDPTNEDYLMNRALIYRRLGEFGLAQNEYSKVASLAHSSTRDSCPPSPTAPRSPTHKAPAVDALEVEDGLFDHLFGKPMPDKVALMCAPSERTVDQRDLVVSRLQSVLFFQEFPRAVLLEVTHHLEYEVVPCGKAFTLGEEHPHNFYVLLSGRLSVRRKLGDFASSVTTHHMDPGTPFGCTGHLINSHTKLIADQSSEIGILWPDAYESTIYNYCTEKNNEVFGFLQQHKAFKLFSTSELGHIIGISERRRYRKGEILLEQNEIPKYLVVVRKGTCLMYQDFEMPPLCNPGDPKAAKRPSDSDKQSVLPYHHLLATPDWPLGFRVQHDIQKKRKNMRGARRNALMDRKSAPSPEDLLLQVARNGTMDDEPARMTLKQSGITLNNQEPTRRLGPGAIFGESTLLEQQHTRAKCSVMTDSVVEVLLFDHLRLQEMELSPEVVEGILNNAPEYMDEEQALKQQVEAEAWKEYKNLRMLELSKTRWPQAKTHLRVLANGCSIMLDSRPSTAPGVTGNNKRESP